MRYANSAKNIKNVARINEDPKDAMLREFQKEIEKLKKKLDEDETSADEDNEEAESDDDDDEEESGTQSGGKKKRKKKKRKEKGKVYLVWLERCAHVCGIVYMYVMASAWYTCICTCIWHGILYMYM